jgi:SWI/SNF-related matrix-associated actin-dependent regulator 1 of chromatin subfamily A
MTALPTPNFTLHWTDKGLVNTRKGPRLLCVSQDPPREFWDYYKAHKEALAERGLGVKRDDVTGKWTVLKWSIPSATTVGPTVKPTSTEVVASAAASRLDTPSAGFSVPFPEGVTPYPFQLAGIEYASSRSRVMIADEMGLGKTLQAIGLINHLEAKEPGSIKSVLIVCPASLKINWSREWEKFSTLQHLSVGIVNGTKNGLPDTDVVIINYDLLFRAGIVEKVAKRTWDHVIADEAHYVKNPKALRSQALLGSPRSAPKIKSNRWTLLSGTPVTNRPADGWNLFRFCEPNIFGKWMPYALRYCNGVQTRFGWDFSGASNLPELQTLLRGSFMVRRLKSEVLTSLPSKVRQIIELPCPASVRRELDSVTNQWELAKQSVAELRNRVAKAEADNDLGDLLAMSEKLKEAESVAFNSMSTIRAATGRAKIDQAVEHILDLLDSDPGLKIVVGAHHKDVIAGLEAGLAQKGHRSVKITGDMNTTERQASVDEFQTTPATRVFIGSILAAGVGITLTASSTVVMVEYDWVPASNQQFEDRCHRIGQKDSVLVQYLVSEGTLDAKMAKDVAKKIEVLEQTLDRNAPAAAEVIEEALRDEPAPVRAEREPEDPAKAKRRAERIATAKAMTIRCRLACKQGINEVHSMNNDRASVQNGIGFSKFDTQIGTRLATTAFHRWTDGDVGIAFVLCRKYRRQLSPEVVELLSTVPGFVKQQEGGEA